MTRLAKFDAAVAGYRPGQIVDLDQIDDPRVDAAIEAGYVQRVTKADVGDRVVESEPSGPAEASVAAGVTADGPVGDGTSLPADLGDDAVSDPKPKARTRKRS